MATSMSKRLKMVICSPKYTGGCYVNLLMEEFDRAANANGLEEKQKLEMLPNFLIDSAKGWYRVYVDELKNSGANAPTWTILKKKLSEAVEVVASSLKYRVMLNNRKQGTNAV